MKPVCKTHVTPNELARLRGIGPEKVLGWIRSGKLSAINISEGRIRPRYLIALTDLAEFDKSLAVVAPAPSVSRPRRSEIPHYV